MERSSLRRKAGGKLYQVRVLQSCRVTPQAKIVVLLVVIERATASQSSTGVGLEQTKTLIAKGRTLTLEEFKYAPESYERALSISSAPQAQLNDLHAWRRCKVWLVEDFFSFDIRRLRSAKIFNLRSARFWLYGSIVRAARAHLRPNSPKLEVG